MIVVVFLRGGADGLALVSPIGDPHFDREVSGPPLDERFALHPGLAPLLPLFRRGLMGVVHAIGSQDATRSHFDAQDRMESGDGAGGWIARCLQERAQAPWSAVALGTQPPESLRGAPFAVFEELDELRLPSDAFHAALTASYAGDSRQEVFRAGGDALRALASLRELPARNLEAYPDDPFGRHMAELARLVRSGSAPEFACVSHDGWDTHVMQDELLSNRAEVLAGSLVAFLSDLGGHAGQVSIVVMTEFGRRAELNASLGTDHGRGSVLFALGRGVHGGSVLGRWPGIHPEALEPPGDLAVTTDYRDALFELVASRGYDAERVFDGYTPRPLGLF